MALMKCPECSKVISDKAVSCPQCGFPIPNSPVTTLPETVECLECNESVPINDEVCPQCGLFNSQKYKYIQQVQTEEDYIKPSIVIIKNPKSRSIAVLLALLLGGLGIHKFYLNKPGIGVLYLLFCWSFIPVVLGLLEGLHYLFMSDKDFESQYS